MIYLLVQTPFGLTAASGQKLYVSDWDKKAIFEVDVSSATATVREVVSGVSLPMAVQYTVVSQGLLCRSWFINELRNIEQLSISFKFETQLAVNCC